MMMALTILSTLTCSQLNSCKSTSHHTHTLLRTIKLFKVQKALDRRLLGLNSPITRLSRTLMSDETPIFKRLVKFIKLEKGTQQLLNNKNRFFADLNKNR